MITLLIVCLIVVTGVSVFIIYNLLAQIKQLEDAVGKVGEIEKKCMNVYTFFLKLFTETKNKLDEVDKRGAFQSDDEVGFVFNVILESIKHVKFQIENLIEAHNNNHNLNTETDANEKEGK